MNQKYDELKTHLINEKKEVLQHLAYAEKYGLDASMRDRTGELSAYDNHPADSGSELFERSKDSALLNQAKNHLNEIDHALEKMEKGTYGVCEQSGEQIPLERLEANPLARTTVEAADRRQQDAVYFDRPAEEDVLGGFDRYNYDGDDTETEFDAEDSLQSVSSFNQIDGVYDEMGIEASEELVGYVDELEGFLSTGLDGYHGQDSVTFERNEHYAHYVSSLMDGASEPDRDKE
ncbi:TraR/DksA C4-type zinc finger protein [Alteribacter natronophilus]|uniref:TraR/DksA C4-type zinc finger protein n=1 Tax=Alteribacter natronophilus TaxID=2583810 RepID=UPI00110E3E48|nr:TraR/DksA C4-type zinc finger protein [Alteribacter natronophilus]TMW73143.1 hypothetical protein FGB90_02190 [Alteribacter natronophilus]